MTEFTAVDAIMNILITDTTILSLVDTFAISSTNVPMIIYADLIPSEWGVNSCSVNLYTVTSISNLEYSKFYFRAACRGNTYIESRQLAVAVVDALNRKYGDNSTYLSAEALMTITPNDGDIDNFNTPVDILIRSN